MSRPFVALGLLAGSLLVGGRAVAFSISSGFSESCHERLGLAAMAVLLDGADLEAITLPSDDLWRRVAAEIAPGVLGSSGRATAAPLTDQQRFVLFSAVVGIRAPDTGGHSVSNLDDLRRAQIDPDPSSQHLHCLRAQSEDGVAADMSVLRGSETLIRQAVAEAAAGRVRPTRNITVPFYLDFYGQLDVEVDAPTYQLGRAMHTLQDCYAHTLRSADGRTVYTVLNYMDGISGELDENRDGMGHSDSLDDCARPELSPLVERAAATSLALARAAVAVLRTGDTALLDQGFSRCAPGATDTATCEWISYKADCGPQEQAAAAPACCSPANAYCGSPYLAVAREDLTQPYVQEVLSCTAVPQARRGRLLAGAAVVTALAGLLLVFLRRRAWRSGGGLMALMLAMQVASAEAAEAAEPPGSYHATVEGHLSVLSDAPERSFIDITSGYAVRGGYRVGRWGALVQLERNYWLPTELSHDVKPGALNIGFGVELLALQNRIRLSATAGPSLLWFTTALDSKGTVGMFIDLRPAGLRWPLARHFGIAFDPLSVALVAPVLGEPGIRQLEYRTLVGVEWIP